MIKKIVEKLTDSERKMLDQCRKNIDRGWMLVGKSLFLIQEHRLYRETHKTFELFVESEFQLARVRAYQLLTAAKVAERVEDKAKGLPAPKESVARELAKLPEKEQKLTWEKMVNESRENGEKPTAKKAKKLASKSNGNGTRQGKASDSKPEGANLIKEHDLPHFSKWLANGIAEYRKYKLPVSAITGELDATSSELKKEKIQK